MSGCLSGCQWLFLEICSELTYVMPFTETTQTSQDWPSIEAETSRRLATLSHSAILQSNIWFTGTQSSSYMTEWRCPGYPQKSWWEVQQMNGKRKNEKRESFYIDMELACLQYCQGIAFKSMNNFHEIDNYLIRFEISYL